MQKLKKAILSLSIALLLTGGLVSTSQNVYGKTNEQKLVGIVVKVDLNARTMEVVERETKKIYTVSVPKGRHVRLNALSPAFSVQTFIDLERVMKGQIVDISVKH